MVVGAPIPSIAKAKLSRNVMSKPVFIPELIDIITISNIVDLLPIEQELWYSFDSI